MLPWPLYDAATLEEIFTEVVSPAVTAQVPVSSWRVVPPEENPAGATRKLSRFDMVSACVAGRTACAQTHRAVPLSLQTTISNETFPVALKVITPVLPLTEMSPFEWSVTE